MLSARSFFSGTIFIVEIIKTKSAISFFRKIRFSRIFYIFLLAFIMNFIWENLHSFLYLNYKGGEITQFILLRASLFDALLIAIISLPFLYFEFLKTKAWLILIIGIAVATFNEWYGLSTLRWAYSSSMPIIPIIKTGLTPTLQLGLLGYISFKITTFFQNDSIR